MKKCYSILAAILILCSMLLCLVGCSDDKNDEILGTWSLKVNMADGINQKLSVNGSAAEYLHVNEFWVSVYMEFKEDDTYAIWIDEDELQAEIDGMVSSALEELCCYMEQTMFEKSDIEMSIEEILAAAEITMDDLAAQMIPEESISELKNEIVGKMTREGRFRIRDGKLFTSEGTDYAVDPEVYETYTLEGTQLTLLEYVGPEAELTVDLHPMVFEKVQ